VLARAQNRPAYRIGYLTGGLLEVTGPSTQSLRQGLRETGFVEGQNLQIDFRGAAGRYEDLPGLAADLVQRRVDAIVTGGGTNAARAATRATPTIPVVFSSGDDPVRDGLVESLARPGGNATGVTSLVTELYPKRLELVAELVPKAKTIFLLVNPVNASTERVMAAMLDAAVARKLPLHILKASSDDELAAALANPARHDAPALIVGTDPFLFSRRELIVALATRHGLPAICPWVEYARAGGLVSYGSDLPAMLRQVGIYTGRILAGERPADLPVLRASTFKMVLNLRTARVLGLTVPAAMIARADEVIE
jgi:putative ABC transport system substrate-binding protein